MKDPLPIINTLHTQLIEVNNHLEKFMQNSKHDIKTLVNFLNETIQKLDHAVEQLTDI